MGLFQPQRRKAETLLLAWLSASLKAFVGALRALVRFDSADQWHPRPLLLQIVEVFDAHGVSFVSVTQAFNTATSMGRLTLNVLLSFAQFEREVTGERIRDKIAASKKKGVWMGGYPPPRADDPEFKNSFLTLTRS